MLFLADDVAFKFFLFHLLENWASRPHPPMCNPRPSDQHLALLFVPRSVFRVPLAAFEGRWFGSFASI